MTKVILDKRSNVDYIICMLALVSWQKLITLFTLLIKDLDCKWLFIDSTHIKAHQHSNGSNEEEQVISKIDIAEH